MQNEFAKKAYLTEKEVATRLGMSTKWLQKMRYSGGGIPYHEIGGAIRYAIEDLEAYEAATRRLNSSENSRASLYTHIQSNNGDRDPQGAGQQDKREPFRSYEGAGQ